MKPRELVQQFKAGRWNQPTLIRLFARTECLEQMLRLPELAGARFSKFIEGSRTDHCFEFFAVRSDTVKEICHRAK